MKYNFDKVANKNDETWVITKDEKSSISAEEITRYSPVALVREP